jgi:hypothetical protein
VRTVLCLKAITHPNISAALGGQITKSKGRKKATDLRALSHPQIYNLLLKFSQDHWTALRIVDDFTVEPGATLFVGTQSAKSHTFVFKDGIRYGCATATRTDADQYAFVEIEGTRSPCLIQYHFDISVGDESPITCSIVQRMNTDEDFPRLGWDL